MSNLRIGQGFDAHKIKKGSNNFILGGITIDSDYEIIAHSDGDIISHAITDALLGASNMGDIGELAPSNKENEDISSIFLLKKVVNLLKTKGFEIINIDLTYIGEEPRLTKYKSKIKDSLAQALSINSNQISCKATTTDGLGYEGNLEGVSTQAIVLISKS